MVSWLGKLEKAQAELTARDADPWRLPLERLHGKIDYDGLERVSSQTILDMLEVPQRNRRAGTYRKLSKLMVNLGWTPVRVRDFNCRGYKEQIRGYCRNARCTAPN